MPLIEGLGDEVTILLGVLLMLMMGLLAWFSTHTSDIPFFSVIIVELSQRTNRSSTNSNQIILGGEENTQHQEITNDDNGITETTSIGQVADHVNTPVQLDNDGLHIDEEEETVNNESVVLESDIINSTDNNQTLPMLQAPEKESPQSKTIAELEGIRQRVPFLKNGQNVKSSVPQVNQSMASSSSIDSNASTSRASISAAHTLNSVSDTTPISSDSTRTEITLNSTNPDGFQIRVRLKYLNDTQRLVFARPLDTIGAFRRTHFSEELSQHKLVRLIFNGQDLRNEACTLQSCNIIDNSVLHCLVTQNIQTEPQENSDNDADANIGSLMIPIFGLLLGALWYLRFNYKQYFNTISTLSLAGMSFLFIIGAFTTWRSNNGVSHENRYPN